jgi:hypothetical protein
MGSKPSWARCEESVFLARHSATVGAALSAASETSKRRKSETTGAAAPSGNSVRNAPPNPTRHLARLTFAAFLLTFIAARTLVILITMRRIPDLFLHKGGTHVHHFNYGIFLLSTICGVLVFATLNNAQRDVCALVYGIGLGLTFDEFGGWLHLGGSYWQPASYDAVIVVLSALGLVAFMPRWQRMRAHHFATGGFLILAIVSFYYLLFRSLSYANDKITPRLMEIEERGPQ